jgi:hypothetical protein
VCQTLGAVATGVPISNGPPASAAVTPAAARPAVPAGMPSRRDRELPPIETYVEKEGWQSGIGYKGMQHYLERMSDSLSKKIPGYILGIAGGKKGVLLIVTAKAKRNFFLAQENTHEFLSAIVNDLMTRMPEPVAPVVTVKYEDKEIIRAEWMGNKVKVNYTQ